MNTMMKWLVLGTLCFIPSGCIALRPIDLTPDDFESYYVQERHETHYLDYVGQKKKYHYLVLHSVGQNGSVVKARKIYRTKDCEQIRVLVKRPQSAIHPAKKVSRSDLLQTEK